jgi:hypothetical protein
MGRFGPRANALAIASTIAGCAIGDLDDQDSSANSVGEDGSTGGSAGDDDAPTTADDDDATGPDDDGPDDDGPTDDGDDAGGEVCNGLDDDADGEIDEDVADLSCGEGVCLATVPGCPGGVPGQCFPGQPGEESCNGLDDDCDGAADEELVQACDSACGPGTQACSAGAWGSCDAPPPSAEACDIVDNDCNGQIDDGVAGCRVGIHRSWHPMTGEHFYTSSAAESMCCGFTLEFSDYFRLYAGVQAGTTAFYRCYGVAPNNFHHYTTDPACEGVPVNEGIIGYIGTSELPGSTALYRSYNPTNGDHFFTTSEAEHDNAVGVLGFTDEGVVGWVW